MSTTLARYATNRWCPRCGAAEEGAGYPHTPDPVAHLAICDNPKAPAIDFIGWDKLVEKGEHPRIPRPFGPTYYGQRCCRVRGRGRALAAGGEGIYCNCEGCF